MKIAVCDDNALFLEEIKGQLSRFPEVDELSLYSELEAFWHSLEAGNRYDAVLMDIDWHQEQKGLNTAAFLYQKSPATKIIYITGYNDRFSQDIFLTNANLSGYLTKPVDPARLKANLEKVARALAEAAPQPLILRSKGTYISVSPEEIYYIESKGHNIVVHAQEEIVSYKRLEHISRMLPDCFFQCHKSFLVNLNQIRHFQASAILLKNGESIPVSRSRYKQTKEAYLRYMGKSF